MSDKMGEVQTVKKIIAKELDLEKNLQLLFEENLEEILNIDSQ